MHFLISGGAGFIGSHIVEQLLLEGHRVTVVDNLVTGNLQNLPQHSELNFIQKDIATCQPRDFTQPIDGIAHLAATPSVAESWLNPLAVHHNNLSTIIAVLLLCKALNIPRLVFASSAAVYGNTEQLPISEAQLACPISPYGLQKLVSEQYINLFAKQLGLSFVSLRLFNVFGPRQLPNSSYSGVISIFTTLMQENLPLKIYGDGTQTRDFIYVKDVAVAFTKALTTPLLMGTCITCNVGMGQGTSLLQLVAILKSCFPKWNREINFTTARTGDIQYSQADITKITLAFGFKYQYSVEFGINRLVNSSNESCQKIVTPLTLCS